MTRRIHQGSALAAALCAGVVALVAQAQSAVDIGNQIPDTQAVKEGLFPDDACKGFLASGLRCVDSRPAVRYLLPAASFRLGSAELPDVLRKQLDVFAEVLRGKKGSGRLLRIESHADASGQTDVSQTLSQRRADAVKNYLVQRGADETMLQAVGMGAQAPKVAGNPYAAENRRVEIGWQSAH